MHVKKELSGPSPPPVSIFRAEFLGRADSPTFSASFGLETRSFGSGSSQNFGNVLSLGRSSLDSVPGPGSHSSGSAGWAWGASEPGKHRSSGSSLAFGTPAPSEPRPISSSARHRAPRAPTGRHSGDRFVARREGRGLFSHAEVGSEDWDDASSWISRGPPGGVHVCRVDDRWSVVGPPAFPAGRPGGCQRPGAQAGRRSRDSEGAALGRRHSI